MKRLKNPSSARCLKRRSREGKHRTMINGLNGSHMHPIRGGLDERKRRVVISIRHKARHDQDMEDGHGFDRRRLYA
jgi:hypothetical protein